MRYIRRALVACPLAALALAAAVSACTAAEFSIPGERFKATWGTTTFEALGLSVRCALTLEGSIVANTFNAVSGTRIGSVTAGRVGACTGGSVTLLSETLPWSAQFSSFSGTLPNVTGITFRLVGASFNIAPEGGFACKGTTTEASPLPMIATRETGALITSLRFEEATGIPLSGVCAGQSGHMSGSGAIDQPWSEGEEAMRVIVQGIGTDLVERNNRNQLVKVEIPAGAGNPATLEMGSRAAFVVTRLVSIELGSPNRERFSLNEGGGACVGGTTNPAWQASGHLRDHNTTQSRSSGRH